MDELLENIFDDLADIDQGMAKGEILDRVDDVLDNIEEEMEPDDDEDDYSDDED
jgi:hypothetical protein